MRLIPINDIKENDDIKVVVSFDMFPELKLKINTDNLQYFRLSVDLKDKYSNDVVIWNLITVCNINSLQSSMYEFINKFVKSDDFDSDRFEINPKIDVVEVIDWKHDLNMDVFENIGACIQYHHLVGCINENVDNTMNSSEYNKIIVESAEICFNNLIGSGNYYIMNIMHNDKYVSSVECDDIRTSNIIIIKYNHRRPVSNPNANNIKSLRNKMGTVIEEILKQNNENTDIAYDSIITDLMVHRVCDDLTKLLHINLKIYEI